MNRRDLLCLLKNVQHGDQREDQISELRANDANARELLTEIARKVFDVTPTEKKFLDDPWARLPAEDA